MTARFEYAQHSYVNGMPGFRVLESFDAADEAQLLLALEKRWPLLTATQASLVPVNTEALDMVLRLSVRSATP